MPLDQPLAHDHVERLLAVLERIAVALEEQARPQPRRRGGQRRSEDKASMARSFVRVQLLDGPKRWEEIAEAGVEQGHAEITLRRYRGDVAECKYVNKRWVWCLREDYDGNQADRH